MAATKRNTRTVGAVTERAVANYLRAWWPAAERMVRTGYRTADRISADHGDLTGTPGITWQIKSLQPATRAERAVPGWLAETEQQRAAAGTALGLLVVRRWQESDVGQWWCFLELADLQGLGDGSLGSVPDGRRRYAPSMPVRLQVRDVVAILRAQGWQTDVDVAA